MVCLNLPSLVSSQCSWFSVLYLLIVLPVFLLFVSPPPPPPPPPPACFCPSSFGISPLLYLAHSLLHCLVLLTFSVSFPPSSSLSCCIASVSPLIFIASGSCLVLVARSEVSVRGIGKGTVKTNHDLCHGLYFVTCQQGIPIHGCSLSSSLPRSSFK